MDQAQMAVICHALNTNLRSIVIVIICPMIWPYGHRISRMSFLYSYSKILPIMTLNVGIQNSDLYFFCMSTTLKLELKSLRLSNGPNKNFLLI